MHPRPSPILMTRDRVRFVGAAWLDAGGPTGSTLTLPAGAAVGDLAIAAGAGASGEIFPTWQVDVDDALYTYSKRLEASDFPGVVLESETSSTSPLTLCVYRGATTATKRSGRAGSSPLRVGGFTKSAGWRAIVIVAAVDGGGTPGATGFATRVTRSNSGETTTMADLIRPGAYTDGTTITWDSSSALIARTLSLELT